MPIIEIINNPVNRLFCSLNVSKDMIWESCITDIYYKDASGAFILDASGNYIGEENGN